MATKRVAPTIEHVFKICGVFEPLWNKIKFNSVGGGRCVAEFKVTKESSNVFGQIHGGCTAMLVDSVSSFALYSNKGRHSVSSDLHMKYIKPAKVGEEIVIEVSTIREGKAISYMICDIKSKATGEMLAQGINNKQML